jgi:hypothetical protein
MSIALQIPQLRMETNGFSKYTEDKWQNLNKMVQTAALLTIAHE